MFKGLQRPSKASAKFLNIGITRDLPIFAISVVTRGSIPVKLGGGVRPASQNPYPIYEQNLRFTPTTLPHLCQTWPNIPYPIYGCYG